MESELAKTLRSMSDDHRMVPDFSEQLLDIADAIERLQKERDQLGAGGKVWQRTAGHLKQERDAALAEVERLKGQVAELRDGFDAEQAGIELRRRQDAMGR